jgi:proline iminopeptidase
MPTQPEDHIQELSAHSGAATLFVHFVGGYDGGPVLVLLHGGPGISHEYMMPLEVLASEELRVVSYDQRGVGRSSGSVTSDPMKDYAEDLEAVRQAIGAERIHLLGHSAGGLPTISYTAAHPERVASIVFVDCMPPTASQLESSFSNVDARVRTLQAEGLITEELPEDANELLNAILPAYFVDPYNPQATQGLNGATYNPITGGEVMEKLGNYDLRPLLARITMPSLSFIANVPFGAEFAGGLADELPPDNSRHILMAECGHFPWIECPEWFFSEVRTFLEPHLEPLSNLS